MAGDRVAEQDPEAGEGQAGAASSEPAETQGASQVPGKTGPPEGAAQAPPIGHCKLV